MFSELHTILRKAVNATKINYNGVELPKYWGLDEYKESGPHIVINKAPIDAVEQELGSNPAQEAKSFLQFLVKLPATDQSLDAQLSSIDGQFWDQFPISSHQDGNFKLVYNGVSVGDHIRGNGYATTTVRINFTAMYCNRG